MIRRLIIMSCTLIAFLTSLPSSGTAPDVTFPAQKGGMWGFIDIYGDWVIKPRFFKALPFSEGMAPVRDAVTWGYINKDGDWIVDPIYEQAFPFSEGLAAVVYDNRWGYIDQLGEFVIPPQFEKASSFSEGLAVVANKDSHFYIDHNGTIVLEGSFSSAQPFTEGLAPVQWASSKGLITSSGQMVLAHTFRKINSFSEGLAQIQENNRFGYIDHSGNIVIPTKFNGSSQFSEGLAAVKRAGKWGYINKKGEWTIERRFESAFPFHYGYAVVSEDKLFGIIDPSGEWVVKPRFQKIYSAGLRASFKEELKEAIETAFYRWQLKGEFEKSSDYRLRMEPDNLQRAMDSIAVRMLNQDALSHLQMSQAQLGYYDADNEYFNVYMTGTLPSGIAVPIGEAAWFKANWDRAIIANIEFALAGEKFILRDFTVLLDDRTYAGNSLLQDESSIPAISWINEIQIPEIQWNAVESYSSSEITPVIEAKPGTSDVDRNIPATNNVKKKTFALIIGNEDYQTFQGGLNKEINVQYAAIDAEIFAKYVNKTLGVPKKNITLLINATAGQIQQALAKMSGIAKAYEGEAEFIFYYAGHGLPDELSRKPYIIPVDVNGSDLSFAISLDEALNTLTEYPHSRVTIFLDACFSGGSRNEGLVSSSGRGVKIRPKSPFLKGNLVMITASSGIQSAFAYEEKGHGMFTYFLLKKLQESKGQVKLGDLVAYLQTEVPQTMIVTKGKAQNPDLLVSPSLEEVWENFRLTEEYVPQVEDVVKNKGKLD